MVAGSKWSNATFRLPVTHMSEANVVQVRNERQRISPAYYPHFILLTTDKKMAKATGIDHIAIYVKDMESAKKFFLEGLGLTHKATYGDEFFMTIGNQIIALFKSDNEDQTINHLALKVDDFEGIKKKLKDLGYKLYDGDMVDGPNGICIQLVS